ncbi:MAG: hypothetical protein VB036_09420 [Propionicimonas sp.]|nr:hypothetical protein [Propionicimonas sp.]
MAAPRVLAGVRSGRDSAGFGRACPGRLGRPGALTLHAAKDQGVWLPRPWVVDGVPLADPLEVANELATSPAVDSGEAITQLWQAL